MIGRRFILHAVLASILAGGLFVVAGVPQLGAEENGNACSERLERNRVKIDRDASRFGADSRQTNRDREKMEADRNWCRNHHFDWDHERFDIELYLRK
jgi:hypothetical protein